jgi:hypothetical protein
MMEQRTLNIINILKGNTKYYSFLYDDMDALESIKQYMADECAYEVEWYTDKDMFDIVYEAMLDYLDHCDKPSFFMRRLGDVMRGRLDCITRDIAIALTTVSVKDRNGNYINGFDDRIHALDREEHK